MPGRQPLSILVTLIIVGFYVLSFFLPFGEFEIAGLPGRPDRPRSSSGLGAFRWIVDVNLDVFRGHAHGERALRAFLMFLPHPLMWAGAFLMLTRAYRGAAAAGLLASLLAVFWIWDWADARADLERCQIGFFIWWGSLGLLMVGGFWGGASDY